MKTERYKQQIIKKILSNLCIHKIAGTASVLVFILCGCGKSLTMADLYGNYTANYPVATENLTLISNGKFVQKVTIKATGKVSVAQGTWKYDSRYGNKVVCDENFLAVVDGFGALRKNYETERGLGLLPIKTVPGQPLSLGASEHPVRYKKVLP
jgi:alpha-D-ribose 1-methylphosphonate 5-triphosphate synthase subunit PhnL